MRRTIKATRIYFTSVTILSIILLVVSFVSKSEDTNTILLWFSKVRLLIFIAMVFLSMVLIFFTIKSYRSKTWMRKFASKLESLEHKPGKISFIHDMFFIITIIALTILIFRYRNFGFLRFIWDPLANYIVEFEPYVIGIFLFSIFSILLLNYIALGWSSTKNQKDKKEFLSLLLISLLVYIVGLGFYQGSAALVGHSETPAISYFPELAEAFSKHNLYIEEPAITKDLTYYDGKYYVSFPPLASLLMLPRVASASRFAINTVQFSCQYAALSLAALFLILEKLRLRKWISLSRTSNLLFVFLFAIGSPQWYMSTTGLVWHVGQILGTCFLAISIVLTLILNTDSNWGLIRSALLAGSSLGLAMLSRPHLGFGWLFLLGIVAQATQVSGKIDWRKLSGWVFFSAIPMAICVAGLGWYNFNRFGSITDFGYLYMLVGPDVMEGLQTFGQFHPHYFWRNLTTNWFGLPYWDQKCHRLAPNVNGMSIFITTPSLLLLYKSWKKDYWIITGWLTIILLSIIHLFYFSTGGRQFGYRFSLDFFVIAMVLLASGFKDRLPKFFMPLIIFSLIVNFIGVLWNSQLWCITF